MVCRGARRCEGSRGAQWSRKRLLPWPVHTARIVATASSSRSRINLPLYVIRAGPRTKRGQRAAGIEMRRTLGAGGNKHSVGTCAQDISARNHAEAQRDVRSRAPREAWKAPAWISAWSEPRGEQPGGGVPQARRRPAGSQCSGTAGCQRRGVDVRPDAFAPRTIQLRRTGGSRSGPTVASSCPSLVCIGTLTFCGARNCAACCYRTPI